MPVPPKCLQRDRAVQKAFGRQCLYCGATDADTLTIDHVKPLGSGGADAQSNKVPCCRPCNLQKGAHPLLTWLARRPDLDRTAIRQRCYAAHQRAEAQLAGRGSWRQAAPNILVAACKVLNILRNLAVQERLATVQVIRLRGG